MRARFSPASQLVAIVVGLSLIVALAVGLARPGASSAPPPGGAATSPSSAAATSLEPGRDPLATGSVAGGPAGIGATGSGQPSAAGSANPSPGVGAAGSSDAGATPAATLVPGPASSANPTTPSPTPARTVPPGQLALGQLLSLLRVAGEQRTGYDRSLFPHWIDADDDGCDARREVLISEAIDPPAVGPGCSLSGGRWLSLYDGLETTDPSTFDVDHVVALAEAWDSGASGWSEDRRTRFANDLDVEWALIAVSASTNRDKSDQDPADWLPPLAGVRCAYLSMWLAVKVRWDLAVDGTEKSAIEDQIGGCSQVLAVPAAP